MLHKRRIHSATISRQAIASIKCINAPTVPRLGRIEIQGGNLTLESCDRINSTVTRTRSKAWLMMQDAGGMNCLFYFRIAKYTRSGQIARWPNLEMQSASVGCQSDEKMRSWLLLQHCELHLCIFALPPNVTLGAIQSHGLIVASHWLILICNFTCTIAPWLGFQECNHCN